MRDAVTVTASNGAGGPALTVHLDAIVANTALLAGRTAGAVMAVVKADGFGHGAVDVARAALAGGATSLGVTSVQEALALRAAGLKAPVLSWLNPIDADFAAAILAGVDLAVPSLEHLAAVTVAACRVGVRARVHLHADVGMARDGAPPSEWRRLCARARVAERGGRIRVVGMMGHLGCADIPLDPHNAEGVRLFTEADSVARRTGLHPEVRHLAATAATLGDPRTHFDLSRVGAGLVGIDPSGTAGLRPAMSLTAPVVGVRDVPAGTPVGYGHTHVTTRRTRLALLPLGYADGIMRYSAGSSQVQLHGRRRRVVGQVSMDQIVVDAGSDPVRAGDVAVVFGPGDSGEPTVREWAGWARTIEHDVVTGIGARVARRLGGNTGPPPAPRPSTSHLSVVA